MLSLTHRSYCAENEGTEPNERLEFLGDAVLGFVIGHTLFEDQPDLAEGDLTSMRAAVVSTRSLGDVGERLGLREALHLGKGLRRESLSGAVLADAFEALLGAVFLDGGLDAARAVALRALDERLADALARRGARNWKSLLQEHTQELRRVTPSYHLVGESGPDHAKVFEVAALIEGAEKGRGRGASKKLAEQSAARAALRTLELEGWGKREALGDEGPVPA